MLGLRRGLGFVVLFGVVGLFAGGFALTSIASGTVGCSRAGGAPSCIENRAITTMFEKYHGPFAVKIVDSGLMAGLTWGINVYGAVNLTLVGSFTTVNASQTLHLLPGAYFYSVVHPTGWAYGGHNNAFTVRGARTVRVPYILVTGVYEWVFTEKCLPTGTNWSVTVHWDPSMGGTPPPDYNATKNTTGTLLTFDVYPGEIYYYGIGSVPGYPYFGVADGRHMVITSSNPWVTKSVTVFHMELL